MERRSLAYGIRTHTAFGEGLVGMPCATVGLYSRRELYWFSLLSKGGDTPWNAARVFIAKCGTELWYTKNMCEHAYRSLRVVPRRASRTR